jgi:hypothetical protein
MVFFDIQFETFQNQFFEQLRLIGNKAIGRYDSISVWFFSGFGNMITYDTFQDAGTCFSRIEALISVVLLAIFFEVSL